MNYVRLGQTGLQVSRLCLGCMSFGDPNRGSHAWTLPEEQSRPMLRAAWEAGINFFDTAKVPVIGLVENMAGYLCPHCGEVSEPFGHGGAEKMCKDYDAELLGSLPLELSIRELADAGRPTVVGAPDSRAADIYRTIARRVAVKVAERAKDMSARFPNIVVQNT